MEILPVLAWFERLIDPYPDAEPIQPPKGFLAFMWAAASGVRRYILLMTLLTALTAAFEALLFSMMGRIVDWLSGTPPQRLWAEHGGTLGLLALVLLASPLVVGLQTVLKHQTLAGAFPMRLRWNFHRLMLGQSMGFYQDEFSGRVAAKVMQTALAVRDSWMIVADILVFVLIYFGTMTAVVGGFDLWLMLPFLCWLVLYAAALAWFVPRLGKVSQAQADARSLMTGRITDAYTNIATVKLFSHARREADHAREAMREFMTTVHAQMRMVSGFEVVNHGLSMGLVLACPGSALWLWQQGQVKAYYITLTDILRSYVEARLIVPAMERTTDDLVRALRVTALPPAQREQLANILQLADLVKFAKLAPAPAENEAAVPAARRFIQDSTAALSPTPEPAHAQTR